MYIDLIDDQIYMSHGSWCHKLAAIHAPKPITLQYKGDSNTPNEWHVGPSGCGKSRSARERFPECYVKDASNEWFENYLNETVVLVEDVDKFHVKLGYQLKIWGDRYAFRANVKGSSCNLRPEKVIITSNYSPEDIWKDATTLEPIYRRFSLHTWDAEGNCTVTYPGNDAHKPKNVPKNEFDMYQSYYPNK